MRLSIQARLLRSAAFSAAVLFAACGEAPAGRGAPGEAPPPSLPKADTEVDVQTQPAPSVQAPVDAPTEKSSATQSSPALTARSTELKRLPQIEAETLMMLPKSAPISVLERQGGWYRVRADAAEGWVRMLDVSRSRASAPAGTGELDTAVAIASGREGSGNVVATTGIRGLTDEQLQTAQADLEALARLEASGVTLAQAEAEAKGRGLTARKIRYLAAPQQ